MAELSKALLRLYARGELAATHVQMLAAAAWADGWGQGDALAQRLASAGQAGAHRGNVTRDIVEGARNAGLMSSGALPYTVELPGGGGPVCMFLPHEVLFHEVGKLGEHCFLDESGMTSPIGRLLRQWCGHQDVDVGDCPLSSVGAIGLHCDGVQYTSTMRAGGGRSIIVCSFNMVTGRTAAVRHRRHILFTLRKSRLCDCGCQGYHSMQAIFEVIGWSMRCAMEGIAPGHRHCGSPWTAEDIQHRLPHGVEVPRFGVLQIRGDWEFLVQAFRFRSYNSERFCWMCDATVSGELSYLNMADDAPHRATRMGHSQYILGCAVDRVQPSNLFRCPGVQLCHVAVDSMHAGDLGSFQDAIGSLFHLEIGQRAWHRTRRDGLESLNLELQRYYAANPHLTKVTPLAMSQLSSGNEGAVYPTLKAKAAQTRHLADFAAILAVTHRDGTVDRGPYRFPPRHRLRGREAEHNALLVRMCIGMQRYHRACAQDPFVAAACMDGMLAFLQALTELSLMWRAGLPAQEQASQPFKVRRKAHMLQHLVRDQLGLWGSPSGFWCYADEDYIGVVKTIAARTRHPATLEKRICEKLMLLSGLEV